MEDLGKIRVFHYDVVLRKSIDIKQYQTPLFYGSQDREAELDILMAMRTLKLRSKLKEGDNRVKFTARYIPQSNGVHVPMFVDPHVEFLEEANKVELEKVSFWDDLKRLLRHFWPMKVNRES